MNIVSLADDDENLTWQDRWEQAAVAERAKFESLTASELVDFVKTGRIGGYYNVWYVIAKKCSLAEGGRLLLDVVEKSPDDLVRYHALSALGQMLGLKEDDERLHASLVREQPIDGSSLGPIRDLLAEQLGTKHGM